MATGTPGSVRARGIVALARRLGERLWRERNELAEDAATRWKLVEELQPHLVRVEAQCARHGATPGHLAQPSRRAFAWMWWLTADRNLRRHARALIRVGEAASRRGQHLEVSIEYSSKVWQVRRQGRAVHLHLGAGFVAAPDHLWPLVGRLLDRRIAPAVRRPLAEFADSSAYASVVAAIERLAPPPTRSSGKHHDLAASFARVNEAYFDGKAAPPRLEWNERVTRTKFGHYHGAQDAVVVSRVLDDPRVPEYVIDFIVHHELLHREVGITHRNGRRAVHTPEFRRRERRFTQHAEAESFLRAFARRNR